jgi:predicted DNA-binding transcriptional regulator AlpA
MNQFSIPVLLRRDAVLSLTGFTAEELQHEIDAGLFPPPVKLSPDETSNAMGWNHCEIATMNAAKIGGANCDDVRKVVTDLVAARMLLARPRDGAMISQTSNRVN